MTVAKRFAVFAQLFNIILLPFCWGSAITGEFEGGLRPLVYVLFWGPLLAWTVLFIGCMLKERRWQRWICRGGLLVFGLTLATLLGSWNYVYADFYQPYRSLEQAETPEIQISWGHISDRSVVAQTLEAADAQRVTELLRQVKVAHGHVSLRGVREEYVPKDAAYIQFWVDMESRRGRQGVGAWPPYYIFSDEAVMPAADEAVCQELADLYAELVVKYGEPLTE